MNRMTKTRKITTLLVCSLIFMLCGVLIYKDYQNVKHTPRYANVPSLTIHSDGSATLLGLLWHAKGTCIVGKYKPMYPGTETSASSSTGTCNDSKNNIQNQPILNINTPPPDMPPMNTIDCKNFHKLDNGNWQSNTVPFTVDTSTFSNLHNPIPPGKFIIDTYDVWKIIDQKCKH